MHNDRGKEERNDPATTSLIRIDARLVRYYVCAGVVLENEHYLAVLQMSPRKRVLTQDTVIQGLQGQEVRQLSRLRSRRHDVLSGG